MESRQEKNSKCLIILHNMNRFQWIDPPGGFFKSFFRRNALVHTAKSSDKSIEKKTLLAEGIYIHDPLFVPSLTSSQRQPSPTPRGGSEGRMTEKFPFFFFRITYVHRDSIYNVCICFVGWGGGDMIRLEGKTKAQIKIPIRPHPSLRLPKTNESCILCTRSYMREKNRKSQCEVEREVNGTYH